jgi:hypothetical protein
MATRTSALIVHADTTVMSGTEDDERDGCRGRDLRRELRAVGSGLSDCAARKTAIRRATTLSSAPTSMCAEL